MKWTKLMIALLAAVVMGALLMPPSLSASTTATSASDWPTTAVVPLSSDQEPNLTSPVSTSSPPMGVAVFQISNDSSQICYQVWVSKTSNVTMAHIHQGAAGQEGPVVAWLYPSDKASQANVDPNTSMLPGEFTGLLAAGTINATDLVGPMANMTISDLMGSMTAGQIYANVHTTQNPGGEIRGQVDPMNMTCPISALGSANGTTVPPVSNGTNPSVGGSSPTTTPSQGGSGNTPSGPTY
jgi:hypothetical protein